MADLILQCGTNDFIVDADQSSMTVNSLNAVTLNCGTKLVVDGGVQFLDFASAGVATFDASGNLSSTAGTVFNTASAYTLTNTWTHSAAVQVNSTLGVTGTTTLAGSLVNSGIATQASVLGVQAVVPPAGWGYAIVNTTTGEIRRMT